MMQFLLMGGWLLLLLAGTVQAQYEEDVYEGSERYDYTEKKAAAASAVVFPSWPVVTDSIEVSLGLDNFPFNLLIDPVSISVDRARVVRYTAILQSTNAVMNISYEAIDCTDETYRRYAYGSEGVFKPVRHSRWKHITAIGEDRFRDVLLRNYLCPVAGNKPVDKLIRRLHSDQPAIEQEQQEE